MKASKRALDQISWRWVMPFASFRLGCLSGQTTKEPFVTTPGWVTLSGRRGRQRYTEKQQETAPGLVRPGSAVLLPAVRMRVAKSYCFFISAASLDCRVAFIRAARNTSVSGGAGTAPLRTLWKGTLVP